MPQIRNLSCRGFTYAVNWFASKDPGAQMVIRRNGGQFPMMPYDFIKLMHQKYGSPMLFTPTGELTERGHSVIKVELKKMGLPENASLKDVVLKFQEMFLMRN